MATKTQQRRAIGIVRVSQTKGRSGESFHSPAIQERRIREACKSQGLRLGPIVQELDVSGGTPLAKRTGMREAVEAVEAGQADVIVAAYFDRLFRSLEIQAQILRRVEDAGGSVYALDAGSVSNGTTGEWVDATMRGFMAEYQRRQARDSSAEHTQASIDRGIPPWPNVTPGYVRGSDRRFYPDPATATVIVEAFQRRADGTSVQKVQTFLGANGIKLSFHGVTNLMRSRVLLGEIHFGAFTPNLEAHEPIVPRELWDAVQRVTIPRGPRPESDRLLARLGVLRCSGCDARMVVGTTRPGGEGTDPYWLYRCPPTGDCKRRVTISAQRVETVVIDAVKQALADVTGSASPDDRIRQAEADLDHAQAAYDALMGILDPLEPAAVKRLGDAKELRDAAREHLEQLGGTRAAPLVTLNAAADWDDLTLDGRRALIRATVDRVSVAPGRGADRVTVSLFES